MPAVSLTTWEIMLAANVGVMRRVKSLKRGETNKVQNKDFGWHTDIESACAELAFAKYSGMYWDGSVNTFKAPDVGLIQVRHTQHQSGCLIVREADSNEESFVLVVGSHPEYRIVGWLTGELSKSPDYKRDLTSWFVPQSELLDIKELVS